MAKLAEYKCVSCGKKVEELFSDTEEQPKYLEEDCPDCGGSMKRDWNIKKNSQCWRVDF